MLNSLREKTLLCIPVILMAGIFFSCENDLMEVERLSSADSLAQEEFIDLTMTLVDSGFDKGYMVSPLMQRFMLDHDEKWIFPKGMEVTFFKPGRIPESRLSARVAELDMQTNSMVLRHNVVFINFIRQDTIFTEEMNWTDKHRDTLHKNMNIYTNKKVLIKGKDGLFECRKGFESNESFTKYDFLGVKAKINVNQKDSL